MRSEMDQPCIGPFCNVRKMRRSRVPWRSSRWESCGMLLTIYNKRSLHYCRLSTTKPLGGATRCVRADSLADAEQCLLPEQHFFRRSICLAHGDGPAESAGVARLAVAVAPELVADRHRNGTTGASSLRKQRVGIIHLQMQHEGQGIGGHRFSAEFREIIVEHQPGVADADGGVHDFAAGAGGAVQLDGAECALQKIDVIGCAIDR